MEKKEIKVKIDTRLYDKAIEYNIDLEEALYSELLNKINEVNKRIEYEKHIKEDKEYEDYLKVLKIIRRISKPSKFKHASEINIIAEAELESISKEETLEILKKLIERNEIFQSFFIGHTHSCID